jgi:hypothetical protein
MDAGPVARGIFNRIGSVKLQYIAADPSIFKRDGGPSIAEAFAVERVLCRRADNTRVSGWDMVRQHLNGRLGPATGLAALDRPGPTLPLFYILDRCEDTVRCLETVPADADKPDDVDTTAEDHAADMVRYGLMSRPWIVDALPPQVVQSSPTMDQIWERSDQRQAALED